MPGRAAVALPAKLAWARPRACRCFLTHSLKPPLSDGLGACDGTSGPLPPPPLSASTGVDIVMPIAVRIDAVVIPCSRKMVRMHFASIVSSWRSRLNVSRILLIWDRRAALFIERASSLACLSSSMSESSPSSFLIRSWISFWILVLSVSIRFRHSRAKFCSASDILSLGAVSFARLFANSSLTSVNAFASPASSLLAWVAHMVSIVIKVVFTCSVLRRALSALPGRAMFSVLLGRAFSSCRSAFTADLLRPLRDVLALKPVSPIDSHSALSHHPRILWPAMVKTETGIFPSSRWWGSFCRQGSRRAFSCRDHSQTVPSRSCLWGATKRRGVLHCRMTSTRDTSGNPTRICVNAGNKDEAVAADKANADAFSNRFYVLLDFELLESHMPFYQSAQGDQLEYELVFNDYSHVIQATGHALHDIKKPQSGVWHGHSDCSGLNNS